MISSLCVDCQCGYKCETSYAMCWLIHGIPLQYLHRMVIYRILLLGTSNKLVRGCDSMQKLRFITLFSHAFMYTFITMIGF